ncbi:MAG: leucine-rich repeat domain-containing protein, partial [Clostridia bacterium]|nr:leucine-rich repeat domain-containing protein [Clostridia bacterium]
MRKERFFELMNETDESLIERAEKYSAHNVNLRAHRIVRWTAIAACICMILIACIAVPIAMRMGDKGDLDIDDESTSSEAQNNNDENENIGIGDNDSDDSMPGNPNAQPNDDEYIELPATEGLKYRFLQNENAYSIYGYEGEATEIIIPSTYNGLPVINIDYSSSMDGCVLSVWGAFSNNDNITSVVIQKNVKIISSYAFSGCTNLKSVKIGPDVETIGNESFLNCTSLERIDIPDSVKYIGFEAFSGCSSLSGISLSDNIETIENAVFIRTAYYNDASNWDNGVLYIGNHLVKAKNVSGAYTVREGTK